MRTDRTVGRGRGGEDFGSIRRACVSGLVILIILFLIPSVPADLDVNAVAGVATIDGAPAPAGTQIMVYDSTTGFSVTTAVDGPNIPPFQKGAGRFDTGDVPQFNTGDRVVVSIVGASGQATATLVAGTTIVNVNGQTPRPPSLAAIPPQRGLEDVAWQLDLDPYLSDPDTPVHSLHIEVTNPYVSVQGHVLTFLYPEGVLEDVVTVYVQDSSFTVSGQIRVFITPVNDPPSIAPIPTISLMQGEVATVELSRYVHDPDDALGALSMSATGGTLVQGTIQNATLTIAAQPSASGKDRIILTVSDPGGLSASRDICVEVSVNVTALVEFYQARIDALEAEISGLSTVNVGLQEQVRSLLAQVSEIMGQKELLESKLRDAEQRAVFLLGELETLRTRRALDAETIARLEAEKLNLSGNVASLQKTLEEVMAAYGSVILELNATRTASEAQISVYRARIAEIEAVLSGLESNSSMLQDLVANLTVEKDRLEATIAAREQELRMLEDLAEGLQAEVQRLHEEKTLTEASLADVNRAVEDLRIANAQLLSQIDELSRRAPAYLVEGNATLNQTITSQPDGILATVARMAGGGLRLFSRGVRSKLGIMVLAMIVGASVVSIVAKTSWIRAGRKRKASGTAKDILRGIQGKTAPLLRSAAQKSLTPPQAPAQPTMLVRRKPSRVMRGRVVVSTRPVSAELVTRSVAPRAVAGHSPTERPGASSAGYAPPARTAENTRPFSSSTLGPSQIRSARPDVGAETSGAYAGDSARLSKADMEYIENLRRLGFTKEADDALRKLTEK